MNKRNKEQLRAAIANDLVQGQGGHSPTRELLRQYAPLEGIITKSAPDILPRSWMRQSLWKTPWHHMPPWHQTTAHHGTVPPWHGTPP